MKMTLMQNGNRWYILHSSFEFEGETYLAIVKVRHYWDGSEWFHYESSVSDFIGQERRIVTQQMFEDRVNAIVENEEEMDDNDAFIHVSNEWVCPGLFKGYEFRGLEVCNEMTARMKAILDLGLFELQISH